MPVKEKIDIADFSPSLNRLRVAQRGSRDLYKVSNTPFDNEVSMIKNKGATEPERPQAPEPIDNGAMATPIKVDPPKPDKEADVELSSDDTKPIAQPELDSNDKRTNWKKRHDDVRTYANDLQLENTDLRKQLEDAGKKPVQLPMSEDQINNWRKENPQSFDTIVSIVRQELPDLTNEVQKVKQELDAVKKRTASEQLFQEILKVHGDAGQIRQSDKFKEWFKIQPKDIRALIESPMSSVVCRGIDMYKSDVGINKQKRDETPFSKSEDAASAVTVKGAPSVPTDGKAKLWTASEVSKLSSKQYMQYRNEIKRAKVEGRYNARG